VKFELKKGPSFVRASTLRVYKYKRAVYRTIRIRVTEYMVAGQTGRAAFSRDDDDHDINSCHERVPVSLSRHSHGRGSVFNIDYVEPSTVTVFVLTKAVCLTVADSGPIAHIPGRTLIGPADSLLYY